MTRLLSSLLFSFFSHASPVNDKPLASILQTQVFDATSSRGIPNIVVELYKLDDNTVDGWQYIDVKVTDQKGIVDDFIPYSRDDILTVNGKYKLVYNTKGICSSPEKSAIYSKVSIEFYIEDAKSSYIPIRLTRYGYIF